MASLSEDAAEVKEGFLCPLCHKDLQSFYQLQEHYEEQHHTAEQRHVSAHIRSFVQKAKKAKDKLLKREGEERAESSYESFYYGGVDPYMWEPQELGATRSHMESFKKHRAARIDHYVIEVNKCIIRLEKLTSFDRTNMDVAQIRTLEKSVVSWVSDQDVPFCPDCGGKFNLRNRRHHCRLCGSIMCRKCTEFVPLPMAGKLISMTREALCAAPPPPALASGSSVAPGLTRRGSVSSISSVASMLEEKDEDRVRCCCHCMNLLIRRQDKLEEKEHLPDVVKLYQRLRACMEKVEVKAPEYIVMAESLCAGETGCTLDNAAGLRMEIQKYYELIDVLSKRILTLGLKDEVPPSPRALQLQRMVRHSSTLFIQEKLLGLTSLPSHQEYEELKEKRRLEQEQKLQREKQAALEAQMRQSEPEKNGAVEAPRLRKTGCWLPQSEQTPSSAEDDPLLQQIQNIHSFLRQARTADRTDEVAMLEENLRQLQDEFDAQQTDRAIQMSRQLAEETELQHRHFQHLQQTQQVQTTHTSTGPPEPSSSPPGANPFDEAEPSPDRETHVSNGKQPYNPFEEESEDQTPGNPFGDDDDEEEDGGHASTNPFDEEDVNDLIEEELLLQQIDNIRAYMFDAKQSGRADEVELLSENLRDLQRTLQQQKHRK